jgi:hypothetical protein
MPAVPCVEIDTGEVTHLALNPPTPTLGSLPKVTFVTEDPNGSEDGPTTYTAVELTVDKITAVLVGTASPSVTWTIRFGSDRSAAGTEIVVGGTTTTNTTTGHDVTVLSNDTIPADSFIWVETTAQSGTVNEMSLTLVFA